MVDGRSGREDRHRHSRSGLLSLAINHHCSHRRMQQHIIFAGLSIPDVRRPFSPSRVLAILRCHPASIHWKTVHHERAARIGIIRIDHQQVGQVWVQPGDPDSVRTMLAPWHDDWLVAQRQPRVHPGRHVAHDDPGQCLAEDGARLVLAFGFHCEQKPQRPVRLPLCRGHGAHGRGGGPMVMTTPFLIALIAVHRTLSTANRFRPRRERVPDAWRSGPGRLVEVRGAGRSGADAIRFPCRR